MKSCSRRAAGSTCPRSSPGGWRHRSARCSCWRPSSSCPSLKRTAVPEHRDPLTPPHRGSRPPRAVSGPAPRRQRPEQLLFLLVTACLPEKAPGVQEKGDRNPTFAERAAGSAPRLPPKPTASSWIGDTTLKHARRPEYPPCAPPARPTLATAFTQRAAPHATANMVHSHLAPSHAPASQQPLRHCRHV